MTARRWLLATVLALGLSGAGLVAVGGAAALAQTVAEGGDPATAPCFEGAPVRSGAGAATAGGPSATGRCEPTTGQRLVDGVVWVGLVALLGVGVVVGVRWWRSPEAGGEGAEDAEDERPDAAR